MADAIPPLEAVVVAGLVPNANPGFVVGTAEDPKEKVGFVAAVKAAGVAVVCCVVPNPEIEDVCAFPVPPNANPGVLEVVLPKDREGAVEATVPKVGAF